VGCNPDVMGPARQRVLLSTAVMQLAPSFLIPYVSTCDPLISIKVNCRTSSERGEFATCAHIGTVAGLSG